MIEFIIKIIDKKSSDIDKVKKLYSDVFEDSEKFTEYFFNKEVPMNTTIIYGGFINNELVSVMFLREKQLIYGTKKMSGCYIYGVATSAEHRGKGYMARLMNEALSYCDEKNYDLVYLIPVNEKIYEKFGFVTVRKGKKVQCGAELKAAAAYVEDSSRWESDETLVINRLESNNIQGIREVSEFSIKADMLNGGISIEKNEEYFRHRLLQAEAEGAGIYVVCQNAKICAVVVTGTDSDENLCVADVICEGSMDIRQQYVYETIKKYSHINPYIRKYAIMTYQKNSTKYADRLDEKDININDEV